LRPEFRRRSNGCGAPNQKKDKIHLPDAPFPLGFIFGPALPPQGDFRGISSPPQTARRLRYSTIPLPRARLQAVLLPAVKEKGGLRNGHFK